MNVYACSSQQVASFVEWIKQQEHERLLQEKDDKIQAAIEKAEKDKADALVDLQKKIAATKKEMKRLSDLVADTEHDQEAKTKAIDELQSENLALEEEKIKLERDIENIKDKLTEELTAKLEQEIEERLREEIQPKVDEEYQKEMAEAKAVHAKEMTKLDALRIKLDKKEADLARVEINLDKKARVIKEHQEADRATHQMEPWMEGLRKTGMHFRSLLVRGSEEGVWDLLEKNELDLLSIIIEDILGEFRKIGSVMNLKFGQIEVHKQ
jgi:DNA repair exonuclease SbcCD ATPase subunit